jgi:hypothetical protein
MWKNTPDLIPGDIIQWKQLDSDLETDPPARAIIVVLDVSAHIEHYNITYLCEGKICDSIGTRNCFWLVV